MLSGAALPVNVIDFGLLPFEFEELLPKNPIGAVQTATGAQSTFQEPFYAQENVEEGRAVQSTSERGRDLRSNQKKHIECPLCSKMFARRGRARTHLATHQGIKEFSCDGGCGNLFW